MHASIWKHTARLAAALLLVAAIATTATAAASTSASTTAGSTSAATGFDSVVEVAKSVTGDVIKGLGLGPDGAVFQQVNDAADAVGTAQSLTDVKSLLVDNFPQTAGSAADELAAIGEVASQVSTRANPLLDELADLHIPDGAIAIQTPVGPGWLRKDGSGDEICLEVTAGSNAAIRGIVGAGTTSPLCGVQYEPLANTAHTRTAFAVFTPNGSDVIAAQVPVGGTDPRVDGRALVPVGGRYLHVDLSAVTASEVTVGFTVGVVPKVTAGYVSGEFGVTATVYTSIPTSDYTRVADAVSAALDGGVLPPGANLQTLTPDQAGDVVAQIARTAGSLGGDPTIKVSVSGELGLGVTDLVGIPVASGGAWLSLRVPRDGLADLAGSAVAGLVGSGYRVGEALQVAMAGAVTGKSSQTGPQQAEQLLAGAWTGDVRPVLQSIGSLRSGSSLQVGASVGLGTTIVSAGTASTAIPAYSADATIAGGKLAAAPATLLSDLGDTVLSLLIPQLVQSSNAWTPSGGWNTNGVYQGLLDRLQGVADGIDVSMSLSPPSGGGIFRVTLATGLGPFLEAARQFAPGVLALAQAAEDAVATRSLEPFGDSSIRTLIDGPTWASAARQIAVGLQLGGGSGVSIAKISAGVGATAYASANPIVLASLVADRDFVAPDPSTPAASIGLDVVMGGKLTLGDSSLNVFGGFDRSVQFGITIRDGGTTKPKIFPTAVTADGFTVLGFSGSLDGQFRPTAGSTGFLALPFGGSVAATFTGLDAQGGVTGTWHGGFAAEGRAFTVANGTLDSSGLHWSASLPPIPGLSGQFALRLTSAGALTGTATINGSVGAAGFSGSASIAGGGYLLSGELSVAELTFSSVQLAVADGTATGQAHLVVGERLDAAVDLTFGNGVWRAEASTIARESVSIGVPNIGEATASLEGTVTIALDTSRTAPVYATFSGEACGKIEIFGGTVQKDCFQASIGDGEVREGGKIGFTLGFPHIDGGVTVKFTLDSFGLITMFGTPSDARSSYASSPPHRVTVSSLRVNGHSLDPADTAPTYDVSATTTQASVEVTPANDGQVVNVYADQAPALLAAGQQVSLPLRYGDNPLGVLVTSADGRTQSSYVLTIHRPALPDTTPPVVTSKLVPAPNSKGWRNGATNLRLTASDPDGPGQPASGVVRVEASIDGGAWLAAGDGIYVATAGEHVVSYRAVDAAGNVGSGSIAVSVDLVTPRTTITLPSPNAAAWYRDPVPVTLDATDDRSGVDRTETSLDGAPWQAGTSLTVAAEGKHTLRYRSVDNAGNQEPSHSRSIWLDMTPPETNATGDPVPNAAGWNNTPVDVNVTATDALSGVAQLQVGTDGGAWQGFASAAATVSLGAEGVHTVDHQAVDVAGNQSTARSRVVRIDLTKPWTTASVDPAPNANGWLAGPADVTLEGQDALSGPDHVEYRLNGGDWQTYRSPVTVAGSGRNVLEYRAVDVAGNVEDTQEMILLIDTTPPELRIGLQPRSDIPVIIGVDHESGIDPAATEVIAMTPVKWADVLHGLPVPETDGPSANARMLTVKVADLAGNTAVVTLAVTGSGGQAKLRVLSWSQTALTGAGSWVAPPNELSSTAGVNQVARQTAEIGDPPNVQRWGAERVELYTDKGVLLAAVVTTAGGDNRAGG